MIPRKKKICAICGNPEYLFSGGKCRRCWSVTSSKPINSVNEIDLSDLIDDADAIFSKYIRMSAADEFGNSVCYTCGCYRRWQVQQAGHFISRSCYLLRWDVRNVKVQCKGCNEFRDGNLGAYTSRLESEFPNLPGILMEEARIIYKPSREEIRAIITEYSNKIECLKEIL
jgi:Bacteriophage Lambda NinG protein